MSSATGLRGEQRGARPTLRSGPALNMTPSILPHGSLGRTPTHRPPYPWPCSPFLNLWLQSAGSEAALWSPGKGAVQADSKASPGGSASPGQGVRLLSTPESSDAGEHKGTRPFSRWLSPGQRESQTADAPLPVPHPRTWPPRLFASTPRFPPETAPLPAPLFQQLNHLCAQKSEDEIKLQRLNARP